MIVAWKPVVRLFEPLVVLVALVVGGLASGCQQAPLPATTNAAGTTSDQPTTTAPSSLVSAFERTLAETLLNNAASELAAAERITGAAARDEAHARLQAIVDNMRAALDPDQLTPRHRVRLELITRAVMAYGAEPDHPVINPVTGEVAMTALRLAVAEPASLDELAAHAAELAALGEHLATLATDARLPANPTAARITVRWLAALHGEQGHDSPLITPLLRGASRLATNRTTRGEAAAIAAAARRTLDNTIRPALRQLQRATRLPTTAADNIALPVSDEPPLNDPRTLHDAAQNEVTALTRELAARRSSDPAAVLDDIRHTEARVPRNAAARQRRITTIVDGIVMAEAAIVGLFPPPPQADLAIVPLPSWALISGSRWLRGTHDSAILVANVDEMHSSSGAAMAASYGIPGIHYLASQSTRAAYDYPAWLAGWRYYVNRILRERGAFSVPDDHDGSLLLALEDAAVCVADTALNGLGWTPADTRAWLTKATHLAPGTIERRVAAVIIEPGAGCAAYGGGTRFEALRREFVKGREMPDDLEFHRAIIEAGPLPLDLLEARLAAYSNRGDAE